MSETPAVAETSPPAPPAGGHPDVDAWIAYHEGELGTDEEQRLRRHLVKCPACVSLVLDLDAFTAGAEGPGAGEELSEFERAAAWRSLRAHLEREEGPRGAAPVAAPRRAAWRLAVPSALAATLAAGVLGLASWNAHREVARLQGVVAALSEPQVNVPIHDLYPDTATRSGGGTRPAEVRAAPYVTLVLNLEEPADFAAYEVEVVDAAGHVAWTGRGLEMSEYGTFTLGLARDFLTPGEEYRVRLHGVDEDARKLLQDYAVRLE
ncbi:MAG TPA: zf-HC2 domain-containing protein [Thermoanaerobaculia bacterium]